MKDIQTKKNKFTESYKKELAKKKKEAEQRLRESELDLENNHILEICVRREPSFNVGFALGAVCFGLAVLIFHFVVF